MDPWEAGQFAGMQRGLLINVQRFNAARFADSRNKNIWPFRKRKTPRSVFDADFPGGGGAKEALVVLV